MLTLLKYVKFTLCSDNANVHAAQLQLEESSNNTSRSAALEKEVKEKTLLIEKLRHEGTFVSSL